MGAWSQGDEYSQNQHVLTMQHCLALEAVMVLAWSNTKVNVSDFGYVNP